MLLDDDDEFLPTKVQEQIAAMIAGNFSFSATEALIGHGAFRPQQQRYKLFNREYFWQVLRRKFARGGVEMEENFPAAITLSLLQIHNYLITSSVCFTRELFNRYGPFDVTTRMHTDMPEDLALWLRMFGEGAEKGDQASSPAQGAYMKQPLVYYDLDHGKRPEGKAVSGEARRGEAVPSEFE